MDRELSRMLVPHLKTPLRHPPAGQTREQQLNLEAASVAQALRLEGYDGPLALGQLKHLLRTVA